MKTSLDERAELLRNDTVLSTIPDVQLVEISASLTDLDLQAGTKLFEEGDAADAVYLIVDGKVRIEIAGLPLLHLTRGELVGEIALLDEGPRSATAVAETRARLLKWARPQFIRLLEKPEVGQALHRALSSKLRQDVLVHVRAAVVQQDLARAREVQRATLPRELFSSEGLELAGLCYPCHDVGGDFYDYFSPSANELGVLICDVQGHGFHSALLVSLVKGAFDTQRRIDHEPDIIMDAINHAVASSAAAAGMLMSCCYVVFDTARGTLRYVNAGHPPPYHVDAATGTLTKLESTDVILGVPGFVHGSFSTVTRPWRESDLLVLYSDGVTDAQSESREFFGSERIEHVIAAQRTRSPQEIRDAILGELSIGSGLPNEVDDVTIVVVKGR